ncbi:MAG: carboxypeptidase-like regulatory domain-containing protein [Gammaproteobacteria bacterium]
MRALMQQAIIATCLLVVSFISQTAYSSPAIDWILSTQKADGSYVLANDIATATQSTSEALLAFAALEEVTDAGIPLAVKYVTAEAYLNTENLSRVITANHLVGTDVSVLLAQLERYQNFDGGFGELPDYHSTPLDTAFALIAMAAVDYDDIDVVDAAISYLINHQQADGSFILSDNNESSYYITALCSIALHRYHFLFDVTAELQAANEYLLSQQIPGAGWGTSWETAVALHSIALATTDSTRYRDSAQVLRSQQLANGSWGNDVFVTALAAKALHLVENVKQPVSPTEGLVTGKVVRDGTLLPLSFVVVSIDELPSMRAATDENGKYTLTALPASTYTIRYQADGFLTATRTVTLQAGQVIDLGSVHLLPAPDIGIISGIITDKASGLPVVGASITTTGAFAESEVSDARGNYSIAGTTGNVTIAVISAGFEPAVSSGVVTAGGVLTFSPSLHPSGTINTDPAVSITGRVIDADTSQAVPQATVGVVGTGRVVNTSANGGFRIENLVAGELIVSITHSHYQTTQYRAVAAEGSAVDLGVIRLYTSISQPATTTISGAVTDAATGLALVGASVTVIENGVSGLTDSNGQYRFDNLSETQFTLVATAVGYFEATGTVSITQPAVVDLDFSMTRSSASNLDIVDMHIETGITTYPALAEIEADAILFNSGSADQTVRMYYKVVNSDNVIVEEGPVSDVPLGADPASALLTVPAGQALETEIEWYNQASPPGDYQIIAQAFDGVSGQLLAERSISITVQATNRIGGAAAFNPPIAQLAANSPVRISATVRNTGNQVIDPTALSARLILSKPGYQSRKDLARLDATITDTTFNDTRGMAIDSNGNIYVTNRQNNTVSRIATDGSVTTFADKLNSPIDIDIAPGGGIYILNRDNSYVHIDVAGTRTETSTGLLYQTAIESLTDGRVLIARGNALYAVSPDGALNKVVSGGLAGPHDMVINSEGDVFIASTDDDSISRYSNGTLSTFVAGINKPYGLAIDANDDLIVTSYGDNSLLRITPDGAVFVIATGLSGPFDVLIDDAGRYIVSNAMSSEIVAIDATGSKQVLVERTINKPAAAVYNSAGDLLVGNAGFSNITRIAADGTVSEFATGLPDPVALLDSGDGGVDVLLGGGSIHRISPHGIRTTIATGLGSSADFVRDPEGDGYLVVESGQNRITHQHADGQRAIYAEALLDYVRVMTVSAAGDVYVLAGPVRNQSLTRIAADNTAEVVARDMPFSRGMAIDANGNAYVSDYSAKQILKIDVTGDVSVLANTPFNPGAITVSASGYVLLAPFGGKTVYRLNPDGSLTERVTLTSNIMYGLVEDTNGNLWISDQNTDTVLRISPASVIDTFTVKTAGGIQADKSGGVYVGSYGGIKYIASSGVVSNVISHNEITNITVNTFALDGKGDYWIPGKSDVTYLFDSASNLLKRFTTLKQPTGIIAHGNGDLVVTNGNNTVVRLRSQGALPEVITKGSFRAIAKESADIALVSSGGAARRLHLVTGTLSTAIPYSASTFSLVEAIAVNPAGGFVLGDHGQNRLHFYDASDVEIDVQVGIVNPRGLTRDHVGTILVANTEPKGIAAVRNDKRAAVYLFDSNGFDYLLTRSDGHIFASSRRDGTITEYDQQKRNVQKLRVPESDALVIDANGDLLSTMPSLGALISVTTDGSGTYRQLASGLSNARDVETDGASDAYITDSSRNTILKLNADGSLSLDAANIQGAGRLSFSPNGDKLVTYAANRLALFEADGARIELPLTNMIDPLTQLGGIDIDHNGAIYLSTTMQNALLKLQARVTEPEIQTGQVVYSASVQLDSLSIDGQVDVDFGAWTPSRSGEYLVEIAADNGLTAGTLTNTLHVGAKTDGQIILTDATVQSGDQAIGAVLTITGADPTQLTKIETQNLTLAATTFARTGRGITADSKGNVYASDITRVVKVTPDGVVSDFVTGINEGIGLAGMVTDSTDTLFAPSVRGLILKITPDGLTSLIGSFPSRVEAVALDYNDQLYAVTSAGKLYKVDKSSGAATEIPADGLHAPRGMTIDTYGNIYVLNKDSAGTGTDPIIRVTPGGVSSNFFDYANFEFEGIPLAADCANNLLFAPIKLPPFKYRGEEDIIIQLIGETGEVNQVLHGPTIASGLGDIDAISYDRFANRLLFYTDWNNGEIFSFPIICGGIDAEVHIITRADVDLSSADPAPGLINDLGNRAREYIWLLSEIDNGGLAIQLNLLLHDLAEGENRPIFSEAFLEFSNSFNPNTPVRVAIDIPTVLASSQVSIATRVDAAQYETDSMVDIAIELSNDSAVSFDGAVELSVIDADGFTVETLPSIAVNGLQAHSSFNLASVWNTGITLAGDYAVVATLKNTTGETLASNEASYRIRAGAFSSPVVTASVYTNKTRYSAWDSVAISGRVRNTSNNAIQGNSVATVTVTDAGGAIVHTETVFLNTQYPGSYSDVVSTFELTDAQAGQYRVILVSSDAATGVQLAQSEYSFDVERIILQGLTGNVQVQFKQLDTTQANTCTENITNLSAEAITGVTVRHLLVEVTSGATVSSNEQIVQLAAGAALSFPQMVTLDSNQPGVYACVLQVDLNGDDRTLATAIFEVTEPENLFDIDIGLGIGARGRLLILLDPVDLRSRDHDGEDNDKHGKHRKHGWDNEDEIEHDRDRDHDLTDSHDRDPRGPSGAPLPSVQRDIIENLLQQAGWSYTIVESSDAFARAMRSGAYSAYALFSEQSKLNEQVQRELVEAVYRGEGLLVSSGYDMRNEKLSAALGIKQKGKYTRASGIELVDTSLHDAASVLFGLDDKPVRIEIKGAAVIANYIGTDKKYSNDDYEDDHHDGSASKHSKAAVTRFSYGGGVAVWIGFDVLAELTGTHTDGILAELLINALTDIDRAASDFVTAGLIPIELSLANKGPAVMGQLSLRWPADASLLDVAPLLTINANAASWSFDLAVDGNAHMALWLQMPKTAGVADLNALLQVGVGPNLEDFDSRYLSLQITPALTLAEIEARLESSNNQHKYFSKAKKEIGNAIKAFDKNDIKDAIKKALKAIEKLDRVDSDEARSLHMDIARAIRVLAMQWTLGTRDGDNKQQETE